MSSSSPNRSHDAFPSPTTERPKLSGLPPRPSFQSKYRRGSAGSIASSIGGLPDTSATGLGNQTNDLSHNAISSLLAHPIVRTGLIPQSSIAASSGHKPPSIRDIPPVTLTTIPQIDPAVFQAYLSQAGALHEKYQRLKSANDDGASQLFQRDSSKADEFSEAFGSAVRKSSQPSSPILSRKSSTQILSPPQTPTLRRPTSSANTPRKATTGPAPLNTIPNVYFEEDFHLENPRTFDVVSERSDVIPPQETEKSAVNGGTKQPGQPGRKALHTNAILQEKLSWYMDTVEVHLIQAISTASTSFFAALGSLKELQSEAADSISRIQAMRLALKKLNEDIAVGGLEIVDMRRRRENLRTLGAAVSQICDIVEVAKKCEDSVDDNKLDEATAQIEGLEDLIAGKAGSDAERIDLRQVKALDGVARGLSDLRFRIGRGFEAKFIDALLSDLRSHVKSVPQKSTLRRWANASLRSRTDHKRVQSSPPEYLQNNENLRPNLQAALRGLANSGHTTRAATAYRESVIREIKSLIRKNLPSSSDDDNESMASVSTSVSRGGRRLAQQEKSAILARNLRALEPEAAEELLVKTYTSVGEALRRLGFQVKVLLDVTSNMALDAKQTTHRSSASQIDIQKHMPSGQVEQLRDDVHTALDLSSLLGQAVDIVQTQITKVLNVRSEQSSKLELKGFLRFFTLNLLFADECEAVSGKTGEHLKGVVNGQVKDFLQNMAENERLGASQTLDSDQWEARDFTPEDDKFLSRILESMTRTPPSWTEYSKLWDDSSIGTNGATVELAEGARAGSNKARAAEIDSQKYMLIGSALHALQSLDHFGALMAGIPSLTPDASQKLLEYLRFFNSRCQQLILGAGATKLAGLKNINTKHLALASQTCSFLVALIPYMREFARRQCPASALAGILPEFDKVKRSFQDHQASIHEKLVEMITRLSSLRLNSMKKVVWDEPQQDAQEASPYMESLTKETGTLYRVLSRYVGEGDLLMIMSSIFRQLRTEWIQAFEGATVNTESGRQRMLRDAQLFDNRLSKLEGSNSLGQDLIKVVKRKKVQTATPVRQAAPAGDADRTSHGHGSQEQQSNGNTELKIESGSALPPAPSEEEGVVMTEAETAEAIEPGEPVKPKTSVEILGNSDSASNAGQEPETKPDQKSQEAGSAMGKGHQ